MNIGLIKKLRAETNAAMNDCKQALQESNDDYEKALDWLKAKNLVIAASKQNHDQKEGRVFAFANAGRFYLGKCLCETDFCANSNEFSDFVYAISWDVELSCSLDLSCQMLARQNIREEEIKFTGILKEKVSFGGANFLQEATEAQVFSYLHSNGKVGALIKLKYPFQVAGSKEINELGQNLAMQVTAMKALAISAELLNESIKQRQLDIFKQQLTESKIPENRHDQVLYGKMQKWYKEVCLLEQEAIWKPRISISKILEDVENQFGKKVEIISFLREEI